MASITYDDPLDPYNISVPLTDPVSFGELAIGTPDSTLWRRDDTLTNRIRDTLERSPEFLAWRQGAIGGTGAFVDPARFGVSGLPFGAWIDANGTVYQARSIATAFLPQNAWPLYAIATLGTFGSLGLLGGAAAGGGAAATTGGTAAAAASGGGGLAGTIGGLSTAAAGATRAILNSLHPPGSSSSTPGGPGATSDGAAAVSPSLLLLVAGALVIALAARK